MKKQYFIGSLLILFGILWGISEMHIIDFDVIRRLFSLEAVFFYLGLFLLILGSNRVVALGFIVGGGWQLFNMRNLLIDTLDMYIPESKKFVVPYIIVFLGLYILSKRRDGQKEEVVEKNAGSEEKQLNSTDDIEQDVKENNTLEEENLGVPESGDESSAANPDPQQEFETEQEQTHDTEAQNDYTINDKTVLSSVNKLVVSDVVFRGGSVNILFGSYFLDLTRARFEESRVILIDVTTILSSIKVKLPKECEVSNQANTFLSKNRDFRLSMLPSAARDETAKQSKVQIKLIGFSFLGSIEIIE